MRVTDRRFLRTEKVILAGGIKILCSQEREFLSVDYLCEEADINKSTFYLHYRPLDQMVSAIEDEAVAFLSKALYGTSLKLSDPAFSTLLIDCVNNEKKLFLAAFNGGRTRFRIKLSKLFDPFFKPLSPLKRGHVTDVNLFVKSSLDDCILSFLNSLVSDGCHFDKEIATKYLSSIINQDCFKALLK